ncbi:hypothetical protein L218DRAFT_949821 [Marasmius fiardii PR-910]|nr:hypothetical protein L218DRAFT_949821 [Marasmius fiardii PR-910]
MAAAPPSDWTRVLVPQTAAHPLHKPINRVYFDYKGCHGRREGISLSWLLEQILGGHDLRNSMDGADEPVLGNADKVNFYIRWPGYEHVRCETKTEQGDSGWGNTRWSLACFILGSLQGFLMEADRTQAIGDMRYRVGPDGVKLSHLILLSAVRVYDDTWRAEVVVRMFTSKAHKYR